MIACGRFFHPSGGLLFETVYRNWSRIRCGVAYGEAYMDQGERSLRGRTDN
jgi:hypothetical protein